MLRGKVVNNDQYYASRRNRIHRGPETQLVKRSVRRSRFAAMLVGPGSSSDDEPAADERRQVSFDPAADGAGGERAGTAGSDAVSDTTAATVRNIGEVRLLPPSRVRSPLLCSDLPASALQAPSWVRR